jgi:arylsulfatase A-like enzyme
MPWGDSQGTGLGYGRYREIMDGARQGRPDVKALVDELRASYWADVAHLDAWLERLLARLDQDADRFATHVVLVSDHGESLGEDGSLGHGTRLTESQIRIPAVILSPRVQPGVRSDVAGSVDVARTLLSLAGVDAAPPSMGGRDLTDRARPSQGALGMRRTFASAAPSDPRLDGKSYALPPYLFYEVDAEGHVRQGNGSGLVPEAPPPVARAQRDDAALVRLFQALQQQLESSVAHDAPGPEVQRALEALGYVR